MDRVRKFSEQNLTLCITGKNLNIVNVFKSGECTFDERCWYKHTAMENKNQTVENTPEMVQRLFSKMENFASKLEVLEKEKDAKK